MRQSHRRRAGVQSCTFLLKRDNAVGFHHEYRMPCAEIAFAVVINFQQRVRGAIITPDSLGVMYLSFRANASRVVSTTLKVGRRRSSLQIDSPRSTAPKNSVIVVVSSDSVAPAT